MVSSSDVHFELAMSQEHANAFSSMMENSKWVHLLNRSIEDLSDAGLEFLKEAKVCSRIFFSFALYSVLSFCFHVIR